MSNGVVYVSLALSPGFSFQRTLTRAPGLPGCGGAGVRGWGPVYQTYSTRTGGGSPRDTCARSGEPSRKNTNSAAFSCLCSFVRRFFGRCTSTASHNRRWKKGNAVPLLLSPFRRTVTRPSYTRLCISCADQSSYIQDQLVARNSLIVTQDCRDIEGATMMQVSPGCVRLGQSSRC